jgi:uncharacterized membrane protein YphA (DoxX/SURF4 family)
VASWAARLDELLGRRIVFRSFARLRVLAGAITIWHLWPFLADSLGGRTYRDAYWRPYVDWLPTPPTWLYVAGLWLGAVAAVAMVVGVRAQAATRVAAVVVAANLLVTATHFHNNRAYLAIVLGALAVGPCDRPDAVGPAWPLWLLRFEASCVYLGSGLSKLLDPDWVGGTVTWQRVVQVRDQVAASPLPAWAVDALLDRDVHVVVAKVVIATELFIGVGLWWPWTRRAAIVAAVVFHVAIWVSADVEVFSAIGIAALVIWGRPARAPLPAAADYRSPTAT